MYLAKFFHRAPGDDDRELLLCLGGDPCLIGIKMTQDDKSGPDDEIFRHDFSEMGLAITALRTMADDLRAQGYVETDHTRYTLRTLLPDPQPKADWQRGLDDLMLSALCESLDTQARRIADLADTPANREPLYLWLAAHLQFARDRGGAKALAMAQAASDAMASRNAGEIPQYAWSINLYQLEARIFELLARIHFADGNAAAALSAIEQACEASDDTGRTALRAEILCAHFPDRVEEGFDLAYRYGPNAFDAVIAHPLYDDYAKRRRGGGKASKGWRWSQQKKPGSEGDILDAERHLGHALPQGYREFLTASSKTKLQIRLPEHSSELTFHAPSALKEQSNNLFDYITRFDDPDKAGAYFAEQYGVSLRDLVPVAEPKDISSCLVVHLGEGERYGWCFIWDHDDPFELESPQPDFAAAIASITRGIEQRDENTLRFFGIYPD